MNLKECMHKKIIYTDEEASITDVSKLMKDNDIGCVIICDENKQITGIITDRDIVTRVIAEKQNINEIKAKDIMTKNVITIDICETTKDASRCMSNNQIRRIPVVQENKVVGIISIGDLARNNDVSTTNVGTTLECICTNYNL